MFRVRGEELLDPWVLCEISQHLSIMDTAQSTLTTLRAAFETGCTLTYEARCRVLSALKVSVKQHRTQVEASLAQDLARCKFVTLLADYAGVLEYIDYSLSHLQSWMKRRPEGAHSYALHEALGVALVLGSWNFPFNTTLKPLICAISAGNCVCVKPSEIAVESSKVVASILRNMNEASVKCLEGDAAVAVALLQVRWDIIAFTGSPSKGRLVAAAAAQHLTPTVLELGGKCPVIIDEDADLDLASSRVAHGRFFNCGQLCLSPDVAFVHEKRPRTVPGLHPQDFNTVLWGEPTGQPRPRPHCEPNALRKGLRIARTPRGTCGPGRANQQRRALHQSNYCLEPK